MAKSYSDDFNRADNDSLGSPWTEVNGDIDISSQTVIATSSLSTARYDADLDSDGHYAELDVVSMSGTQAGGPMVRFSSSANSGVVFYIRSDTNQYRVFRVTNGSLTQLGSTTSEATPSQPFTARLTIDTDDNITASINGVAKVSTSDATWAGNTRGGMYINSPSPAFDNWKAEDNDFSGGGTTIPIFARHYMNASNA